MATDDGEIRIKLMKKTQKRILDVINEGTTEHTVLLNNTRTRNWNIKVGVARLFGVFNESTTEQTVILNNTRTHSWNVKVDVALSRRHRASGVAGSKTT